MVYIQNHRMMANIVSRTVTTPASQQYPKCPNSRHTHTVCQKVGTAHCSVPFQGGSPRGPSLPPGHQCLCRWQDPHLQFPKRELSEGDESQWQRLSCAVLLYSGQQVGGRSEPWAFLFGWLFFLLWDTGPGFAGSRREWAVLRSSLGCSNRLVGDSWDFTQNLAIRDHTTLHSFWVSDPVTRWVRYSSAVGTEVLPACSPWSHVQPESFPALCVSLLMQSDVQEGGSGIGRRPSVQWGRTEQMSLQKAEPWRHSLYIILCC